DRPSQPAAICSCGGASMPVLAKPYTARRARCPASFWDQCPVGRLGNHGGEMANQKNFAIREPARHVDSLFPIVINNGAAQHFEHDLARFLQAPVSALTCA